MIPYVTQELQRGIRQEIFRGLERRKHHQMRDDCYTRNLSKLKLIKMKEGQPASALSSSLMKYFFCQTRQTKIAFCDIRQTSISSSSIDNDLSWRYLPPDSRETMLAIRALSVLKNIVCFFCFQLELHSMKLA